MFGRLWRLKNVFDYSVINQNWSMLTPSYKRLDWWALLKMLGHIRSCLPVNYITTWLILSMIPPVPNITRYIRGNRYKFSPDVINDCYGLEPKAKEDITDWDLVAKTHLSFCIVSQHTTGYPQHITTLSLRTLLHSYTELAPNKDSI